MRPLLNSIAKVNAVTLHQEAETLTQNTAADKRFPYFLTSHTQQQLRFAGVPSNERLLCEAYVDAEIHPIRRN